VAQLSLIGTSREGHEFDSDSGMNNGKDSCGVWIQKSYLTPQV
jgi:hypothetical protein